MPRTILFAWETSASLLSILTPFNRTKIHLGGSVNVVDMAIDVFGGFEAPTAMWAMLGVGMGFEVAAGCRGC
jgi:hypothetical protein